MQCIAVIGLGNIAKRHRANIKNMFPRAKVLAMSASGRVPESFVENADEIVRDLSTIIALKIDFAIVASPSTYHAAHTVPLLEAGIPVLIEKPVTASSVDTVWLKKIQLKSNPSSKIAVGYCLRYLPSAILMKELLDQNIIGDVHNVFTNVGQFLPDWRDDKEYKNSVSAKKSLGGGALLELSHELDYLQWFLGDLHYNHAVLRNSLELSLEVEEIADIVLSSTAGILCHVHMDFIQKKAQRACSFIGSQGRLDWDILNNSITLVKKNHSEIIYEEPKWDKNQMYIDMIRDFVLSMHGLDNKCISLTEASKTVALIEVVKEKCVWGVAQ